MLYGVNHITDQLDIILEPQTQEPGRIKAEFLHVKNYFKIRPDVVYITFSNYGILLLLLRKIHIVQALVVALFHEYQENLLFSHGIIDKVKRYVMNWFRRVELSAADYPIFISKYGFEHARSARKQYVPLMPELLDDEKQARKDENNPYIIAVGKTKRNYEPLFYAAEQHHDLKLKIITNHIDGAHDLENVHIIDR